MRTPYATALVALLALSCSCPQPAPEQPAAPPVAAPAASVEAPSGYESAVAADHPQYARVEGTSFQNGCQTSDDCHIGGCSSEVCSAEEGVSSTCESPADGWPVAGAACACSLGTCSWVRPATGGGFGMSDPTIGKAPAKVPPTTGPPLSDPPITTPPETPPTPSTPTPSALPTQGTPCDAAGHCAAGLTCQTYYGIAGPRGPKFTSCEIRCKGKGGCPDGQRCVTIADGPGQVCRP